MVGACDEHPLATTRASRYRGTTRSLTRGNFCGNRPGMIPWVYRAVLVRSAARALDDALLEVTPMETKHLDRVVIRFAGDSGDGMQLAGTQFTNSSAILGNDIATFPDFPAEIRAPAGTLAGVSGFQIHFSSSDIHTPGDRLNTLVAMNPAAFSSSTPTRSPPRTFTRPVTRTTRWRTAASRATASSAFRSTS